MIKRFLIFCMFIMLFGNSSRAQGYIDTIFTAKDTLVCHITLVNEDNIFYIFGKNVSSYISRKDVMSFAVHSTDVEYVFAPTKIDRATQATTNEETYLKGYKDGSKYYSDYTGAGTGTLIVSLLSPLVGLIPAIACSSTPPKEKNLGYRNAELMQNMDYRNGYTQSARKIKKRKVWTNWGIALGVNFVIALAISAGQN